MQHFIDWCNFMQLWTFCNLVQRFENLNSITLCNSITWCNFELCATLRCADHIFYWYTFLSKIATTFVVIKPLQQWVTFLWLFTAMNCLQLWTIFSFKHFVVFNFKQFVTFCSLNNAVLNFVQLLTMCSFDLMCNFELCVIFSFV